MNAVYKLIFNVSTGTWAVASELTASRGKKSRTRLAAAMAVALVMPAGAALAADSPTALQCAVNEAVSADGLRCEAASSMTTMSGAIGVKAALTDDFVKVNGAAAGANPATAAGGGAVAIGDSAKGNTSSSVAIGYGAVTGVAGDPTNTSQIAIGATASALGLSSVAIGSGAATNAQYATAFGRLSNATGVGAVALGNTSKALAVNAAALGNGARVDATGTHSTALGANSSATAVSSVALGASSVADQENTISVGRTGVGLQRRVVNMAAGTAATDAVNVSQLTPVIAGLGGGAKIDAAGVVTGPTYNFGTNGSYNDVGSALGNLDGRVAGNTTNLGDLTTRVDGIAAGAGLVTRDTPTGDIHVGNGVLGGAVSLRDSNGDSRFLTGVKAGIGNNDAVNVGQLKPVVESLGGGAKIDPASGIVTGPTYTVGGNTVHTVGDALTDIDGRTTTNTTNIAGNTTAIENLTNGTTGLVQQASSTADLTVGKDTGGTAVDFAGTNGDRTLSGVKAGTVNAASNEAINGSQLHGTAKSVADSLGGNSVVNPDGTITSPVYNIGGTDYTGVGDGFKAVDARMDGLIGGTEGLVTYNDSTGTVSVAAGKAGDTVDFSNNATDARTLTGVAAGTVNAASKEAINGSQLYGTATSVANGLGGGSAVNPDGTIQAPTYKIGAGATEYNNVGDALTDIDGRVITNTDDISGLKDGLAAGTVGLVQQAGPGANLTVGKDTDGDAVDFTNKARASRKLIGVAAGEVSATSNEAINGSQLYGTAKSVADSLGGNSVVNPDGTITSPVYNIGGTDYTGVGDGFKAVDARMDGLIGGTEGLVTYNDSTGTVSVAAGKAGDTVNVAGMAGDRKLSGVDRGMAENDAANIAQLKDVTAGLGGGATVNPDGTITGPTYKIGAAGTEYNNVGDALTNIDGRTTTNEGNITHINTRLDGLADGTVGLVQQAGADADLTVGKATGGAAVNFAGSSGDRKLTGVAAGDLTDTSTDAVNGSQLKATNDRVAINENDITNLDGRVTLNEGDITNLNTVVQDLSNGTAGLVKQDSLTGDVSIAAATGGTVVNVGGSAGARRLAGVANGVADDEAATIAQLKASGLVDPNDGRALGAVVYDDISLGRATLGGTGGTVLGNVGNGLIGAGSMEAINGGQLFQMNADWESKWSALDGRVGSIERGVGDGSIGGPGQGAGPDPVPGEGMIGAGDGAGSIVIGDGTAGGAGAAGGDGAVAIGGGSSAAGKDSVAIGSGSIADRDREVSVGAPGAERVIGNVAAGTRPTDAVNLKQMDDRFAAERDWSNSRFQAVDKRIDRMGAISAAYAGMAINTAGLNGDNRVGAGIGSQNGRSALAVGYQRILGEKKNVSVSLGGAFSGSDQSVSAGAGFSW
ncbi:YadA-like family protein [Stenotrophomonas sp. 169]|uniref:ESPR-type extended signal peptide-containing protein n=1 Tax=Stenotrophomonas sp. 169 TaxID=2770322 RepID=UPI00166255C3|nr:ESPR-type extended signal peptide-containing protein [Stenotrophomonas sp. 169]QNR97972.1 YadA-like family protein [Stenotrophomonas sp. 169]